jgi:hypothetical protein
MASLFITIFLILPAIALWPYQAAGLFFSLFLCFLFAGFKVQSKKLTLKDVTLRFSANENCATICDKSLVITFDTRYFQKLTHLEQKAVVWHELAHVMARHNGLERSYEKELSCDLFAAKKVSFAAIIGALKKIDENDEEINERIKALTKLSLRK